MIVFLLLVIVAILLFGSSAVIGLFGVILGSIVAIFTLAYATHIFNVGGDVVVVCVLAGLGLLFLFSLGQKGDASLPHKPLPPPPSKNPPLDKDVQQAMEHDRLLAQEFKTKIERKRT